MLKTINPFNSSLFTALMVLLCCKCVCVCVCVCQSYFRGICDWLSCSVLLRMIISHVETLAAACNFFPLFKNDVNNL